MRNVERVTRHVKTAALGMVFSRYALHVQRAELFSIDVTLRLTRDTTRKLFDIERGHAE